MPERTIQEIKDDLSNQPTKVVVEIAGSNPTDHPYAPIEPKVISAANQLVREAGLEEVVKTQKQS